MVKIHSYVKLPEGIRGSRGGANSEQELLLNTASDGSEATEDVEEEEDLQSHPVWYLSKKGAQMSWDLMGI